MERTCKACDGSKPLDEFPKNAKCKGGYEPRCKSCKKAGKKGARGKRLPPPDVAEPSGPPTFLSVEKCESYVINGGDGVAIELQASEMETLYQWWKIKRKAA